MIRFEWNNYIQDQLRWANRLAALANDQQAAENGKMLCFAKRAIANSQAAHQAQSGGTY